MSATKAVFMLVGIGAAIWGTLALAGPEITALAWGLVLFVDAAYATPVVGSLVRKYRNGDES